MISYQADSLKIPVFPKRTISTWIKQIASKYGFMVGSISYIFCLDDKILELNKQYLQHDYYTDIITFDYTEGKKISGDIFISLETVSSNAEKFKVSFEQELYRVLIHGVLHLCGQDDKTIVARAKMTQKENEALLLLDTITHKTV